jgi:predicted glycoside hydrolase/deacetylase ChbG (UPF0249 family)
MTSCQRLEPHFLIIHADDAGMCHNVNRATQEALQGGLVTSASIMVPCPGFEDFAAYAVKHPEYDYGIHLVLNSEWETYRWKPLTPPQQVPSLIDSNGYFWGSRDLVRANVVAAEAERELRAQIERARQRGIRLSHLDSHMLAMFTRPDLARVYLRLAMDYHLPILAPRQMSAEQAREFPEIAAVYTELREALEQRFLPMIDHMDDNYNVPVAERREYFLDYVRSLKPGITEIIIHCGYDDSELREISPSAALRDTDRTIFTSDEMAREIRMSGAQLVDWSTLRALHEHRYGPAHAHRSRQR